MAELEALPVPQRKAGDDSGPPVPPEPDSPGPPLRCPFCGSTDAAVISLFGSQVMTMQCKCRACGSFYEASKY